MRNDLSLREIGSHSTSNSGTAIIELKSTSRAEGAARKPMGAPSSVYEGPSTSLTSTNQSLEIGVFAPKVEAAWKLLGDRYGKKISTAELDHLHARFIFGLTSPSYADGEPSAHFDICRELLGLKLSPERVHAALHSVPEPTEPWVEGACETLEQQGTRIGLALTAPIPIGEARSDAHTDAAASTDKQIEEKQS
jgi:hypothetical protein